jgi:uncharacterized membrane protein YqgA involved in biofilm formation
MEFLIIGIVSALNLIVITHKFKKGRYEDGIFDSILFGFMAVIFSGSYGGMVVAMISSLIISIYLWASPPKFFKNIVASEDVQDLMAEVKSFTKPYEPKKRKRSKLDEVNFD